MNIIITYLRFHVVWDGPGAHSGTKHYGVRMILDRQPYLLNASRRRRHILGRGFPYSMKLSLPSSNVESIHFADTLVEFNGVKSTFYRHFFPKTYDSHSRIPSKMLFPVPTFLSFPNYQSYITPSTSNTPSKAHGPKPHFPT